MTDWVADGDGVREGDRAGTHTFKRDGAGVTAPVVADGFASYTPGISERRSGTTTYLHSGLKNNAAQTGTGQTVAATRTYDAFGNVVANTGTFKGPFGYAGPFGYQEDGDSGLKLLGHRYYDSSTGRFLTRDPIKDGRNWYIYCGSKATVKADPTGLQQAIVSLALRPVPGPGQQAGQNAIDLVGEGPNDCKMWLNRCYEDVWPMPPQPDQDGRWTRAGQYDDWFAARPLLWHEVANDGNYEPGDVIVIDRGTRTGHVQIIGSDGALYDASVPTSGRPQGRPGTRQGPPTPGGQRENGANVTAWRPGPNPMVFRWF